MKKTFLNIFSLIISLSFLISYESLDHDFLKDKKQVEKENKVKETPSPPKKNNFNTLTKGCDKIDGLFDFYWSKDENKCYLSISPDQLNQIVLLSITRQTGDGYRYDGSSMLGEFPISFKKIGNNIQIIRENMKFRANQDSAIFKALNNNITESIFSTSKIEAISDKDSSILINASNLFVFDFPRISNQGKYLLDKKNSYFDHISSFILNSEIDIIFHYKGKKTGYVYTLPSSSSMLLKYHISLSALPNNNYNPRVADDRVGHFLTMYQDYSDILSESPYVRYINRWHLEKKNPLAKLSEPKKPIVYWIENTVPHEFRPAVRDGILGWNKSFEKIGFKNAVVAKQMPDNADWNPADIRYSTIRWMIHPGSGYAVGPSRANPITGELYDADIRISTDYIRYFYTEYKDIMGPLTNDEPISNIELNHSNHLNGEECNYAFEKKNQMAFLWNYMITKNIISGTDEELERFVYEGIVDLILHEVGHTLGLRHNFKASSMLSVEELSDPKIISKYNITSSVMDYTPANIFDKGQHFFLTEPGLYDDWAIEYAYSTCEKYKSEEECLEKIISKSISNPRLVYATDEDTGECDPLATRYDMSSDPIEYYEFYLEMIQEYWEALLDENMIDGQDYNQIRNKFSQAMYEYFRASRQIPYFIGGIHYSRHHIGDIDKDPFTVVDAEDQRRAIDFLDEFILSSDAFDFSPELLNKLAPTRLSDFEGTLWEMNQLDYPIHQIIRNLQTGVLRRIYNIRVISRVHNNELRFNSNQEIFTLFELFDSMNNIIWEELKNDVSINSFRRELQSYHIDLLNTIYQNDNFPIDAQNLALESMQNIYKSIIEKESSDIYDNYTSVHLINMKSKIEIILDIDSSK